MSSLPDHVVEQSPKSTATEEEDVTNLDAEGEGRQDDKDEEKHALVPRYGVGELANIFLDFYKFFTNSSRPFTTIPQT